MKRLGVSIALAAVLALLLVTPVVGQYYLWINVTEEGGVDYTQLALNLSMDVDALVDEGFITATGLDTRVTDSDLNVLPHLLAEDRLLWAANITANTTTQFIFWADQALLDSYSTMTGYGGYVTINDTAALEPGNIFWFQIAGYVDTTAGANKSIIRKDGAITLSVTGSNTLGVTITGGTPLEASSVNPGYHVIVVASDGITVAITVDDVLKDEQAASTVPDTANDWYLFENDVMPYVTYYDEWVGST